MKHRVVLVAAAFAALTAPLFVQGASAQTVVAKAGTQFEAAVDQELNTKTLHDGDTFTLTEHEGFFHHAPDALKGATIDGHVENVSPAHTGHGATMNLIFDDVKLANGQSMPIAAQVTSAKAIEPHTHHLRDVGLIVGGAVAGHMVGKRTGHAHGGLAGAAAGFALATSLKSNIDVKKGTILHLKLTQPLATSA